MTVLTTSLHGISKCCGCETENWAPFIVASVSKKLDEETRQKFEESLPDSRKVPTIAQLSDFLDRRYQVLLTDDKPQPAVGKKKSFAAVATTKPVAARDSAPAPVNQPKTKCNFCDDNSHHIRKCQAFQDLKVQDRINCAKTQKLCLNCLGDHKVRCNSRFTCMHCKGRHHSLLHLGNTAKTSNAPADGVTHNYLVNKGDDVILATALVKVRNLFGKYDTLRALIDPGSQDSFITADAAGSLGLQQTRSRTKVSGIGGATGGKISSELELQFQSHFPSAMQFRTTALVLPRIATPLPGNALPPSAVPELPGNLMLADPTFSETGPIDILLGAGIFAEIIKEGTRKFNANRLLLQNTELGWILTGHLLGTTRTTQSMVTLTELDAKLKTFWEIPDQPAEADALDQLDESFVQTTTRDESGRYTVHLPKKNVPGELGASRKQAMARFINLEKSFQKNPHLAAEYTKFLKEYNELGHMTRVPPFAGPEGSAYYLPHHAVIKESSTTTKVRVVFNASAKTHTGLSLNHLLEPGHKQQQDLHHIILRWRKHQFVVTADIEKMFRQIMVTPKDRDLQRILWRENPAEPIQEYQLNTVTYGTASATYLAVRTLIQLARDDGHLFPLAKEVLLRDFYMDDLLSGGDTIEDALLIQKQITELLLKGGFNIRKWTTNSKALMDQIPEELQESGDWSFNPDATIKTLGVIWNPQRDEFCIKLCIDDFKQQKLTKRALLSNIATIFDPLGFLAPISFTCKTWMQQLWTDDTDWDQHVSEDIEQKWNSLYKELPLINEMTLPRWIQHSRQSKCQIHGFCDASEKGYAAVVYSRILDSDGQVHICLLASKSRVAPLKNKLTLPRLELSGAVLLAQLVQDSLKALMIDEPEIFMWCDSQIALAWIAKPPSTWTTFVANRVSAVQQMSKPSQWRYVNTKDNPADVASRGCSPATLQFHPLWWKGPIWLSQSSDLWPTLDVDRSTLMEKKSAKTVNFLAVQQLDNALLLRYSSFLRLQRVTAWILRFKNRTQRKGSHQGTLQPTELEDARCKILLLLQQQNFGDEIKALQVKQQLPRTSRLNSLSPYIDDVGLLRVGGRLRHSILPLDAKHPVLLPRDHHLTKAIIRETHLQTLHGGAQVTLAMVRQLYWISNGRSAVQAIVRSCGRCRRFAAAASPQQMGDLPANRIQAAPAFTYTGVDYCGPFLYRCSKGRGIKTTKGYIAVFVCFSSKAIHLELVSDLTTAGFLAALKRFTSRRGLPLEIHSDNGTNFQGASKEISQQFRSAIQEATALAQDLLANDGVTWRFIPVTSPHIGGLWEAGVKSVKHHLKRTLDDTKLTFEEFTTLLCQIEACLNSRPLYATSSDPADLAALTPGHFLINRPLLARPEPAMQDANPVSRWELLIKMHQEFWNRWSMEYLTQLQQRTKWQNGHNNPAIGELVLLKDRHLPPTKWALGRITQLHTGSDQKVRLVTIRTKGNQLIKQPLVNLCRLPTPDHQKAPEALTEPQRAPPLDQSQTKQRNSQSFLSHRTRTGNQYTPYRTIIPTLLLLLMAPQLNFATSIIKPKPGLFIEKMGQCQVKRGVLRLQLDFNYEEMERDNIMLIGISGNLSQLIRQWSIPDDEFPSKAINELLRQFQRKMDHTLDRITELQTARKRDRRGLLGTILTSVFGVNDEVYAELHLLERNQATNAQNHLRLTTAVERSQQEMQQHYNALVHNLHQTNQMISELNMNVYAHTAIHHLMAAYNSAINYLAEVAAKYEALEKAVIGRGSILDIVSPSRVNEVILNATDRLPTDIYVRHTPQDRVEMKTTTAQLTIFGFFDIASTRSFELVHVTPIPEERNATFLVPTVTSRTIALSYNDQMYFELNEGQLAACHLMKKRLYLCDAPVLYNMDFTGCSVLSLLYNRTDDLRTCPYIAMTISGVLWQKLLTPNTWLFATLNITMIAVICNSEREDLQIMGTGLIHLNDGCIIKTPAYTIGQLYFLEIGVTETFMKEVGPYLGDPPVSRQIKLKDPPPFTNPTAIIAAPLTMEVATPADSQAIYHHLPWLLMTIAAAAIYGRYRWSRRKPRPATQPRSRRHSAPSLGARFDAMLSSLPPQNVQPHG